MGEVRDLGFARRIGENRLALGQDRRHQQVFRAAHGNDGKDDRGALQSVGRRCLDIALVEFDLGAQLGQGPEMQIDGPRADGAAARQRDLGPPVTRQQGPENEHRSPHLAHQIVGRRGAVGRARGQFENPARRTAALAVHGDLNPEIGEQARHGGHVDQVRKIGQRQGIGGQKACRHQRQGRVLGPSDGNGAAQRIAANDTNSIHGPFLVQSPAPHKERRRRVGS